MSGEAEERSALPPELDLDSIPEAIPVHAVSKDPVGRRCQLVFALMVGLPLVTFLVCLLLEGLKPEFAETRFLAEFNPRPGQASAQVDPGHPLELLPTDVEAEIPKIRKVILDPFTFSASDFEFLRYSEKSDTSRGKIAEMFTMRAAGGSKIEITVRVPRGALEDRKGSGVGYRMSESVTRISREVSQEYARVSSQEVETEIGAYQAAVRNATRSLEPQIERAQAEFEQLLEANLLVDLSSLDHDGIETPLMRDLASGAVEATEKVNRRLAAQRDLAAEPLAAKQKLRALRERMARLALHARQAKVEKDRIGAWFREDSWWSLRPISKESSQQLRWDWGWDSPAVVAGLGAWGIGLVLSTLLTLKWLKGARGSGNGHG